MMNSVLFVLRQSPYGSSKAREILDMVFASAVFDREIALLFTGPGLFCVTADQSPQGTANVSKNFASLPIYGVDKFYAVEEDLLQYELGIDQLALDLEAIPQAQLSAFYQQFDQVMVI